MIVAGVVIGVLAAAWTIVVVLQHRGKLPFKWALRLEKLSEWYWHHHPRRYRCHEACFSDDIGWTLSCMKRRRHLGRHSSGFNYWPKRRRPGEPPRPLSIAGAIAEYDREGARLRREGAE